MALLGRAFWDGARRAALPTSANLAVSDSRGRWRLWGEGVDRAERTCLAGWQGAAHRILRMFTRLAAYIPAKYPPKQTPTSTPAIPPLKPQPSPEEKGPNPAKGAAPAHGAHSLQYGAWERTRRPHSLRARHCSSWSRRACHPRCCEGNQRLLAGRKGV